MLNKLEIQSNRMDQSLESVEYTDCISAEE